MASTDNSDACIAQQHQNDASSKVELIINHQFAGVELVSPVYAGDIITCYLSPNQNVEVGFTVQAGFNINYDQGKSIGALMYKLQRNNIDQSNEETISSEGETACTHLIMIWKIYESGETFVDSILIEYDKSCVWDQDSLSKLAEHYNLFDEQDPIENTWLMRDNTVLMTSLNLTREEAHYKLEMTLSEGSINEDTWRPQYVGMNR
jgi:hypothetical protein